MKFSERQGYSQVRVELQLETIDDALRNKLWNSLSAFYIRSTGIQKLIWGEFLKRPLDDMQWDSWNYDNIRDFYFSCQWFVVYDFIEFLVTRTSITKKFMIEDINRILTEEMSGYRLISYKMVPITDQTEIDAIAEGIEKSHQFGLPGVKAHLQKSLAMLSDRKSPDYRNSIKESISAVESLCKIIAEDEKATLGQALKVIEQKGIVDLHPALKEAFSKLYGYTNDENGIRHAHGMFEKECSFEDAKYMHVVCSAFVNYLIAKFASSS